jgi:imidazolonepropionase-like amidohydrolase
LDPPDTLLAKLADGRIVGTRYVPAQALESWRNQLKELKQEKETVDWPAVYRADLRNVAEMHRAGVTLVAGTDIGAPLLVPGFSLHDELALLVSVGGLTPTEALDAATEQPARVLKVADSLGTVAPGKIADLVLLEADPRADIRNTRRIAGVVVNGRWLDRTALDQMLAEVEAAAKPR